MKLLGIFITVKGKEEALHCIDAHIYKYKNKHAVNDRQGVAICKEYCHDAISLINECFAAEMWGPQKCVKRLMEFQKNDNINNVNSILLNVIDLLMELRRIVENSVLIEDLPSCKELTGLSFEDAVSAAKDLTKCKLLKNIASFALLVKNGCNSVKISNVEEFYMGEIAQLQKELDELGREMSPVEIFLMKKYKAELAYCHQARIKTNIGIAKEVIGLIKDAEEAIRDYEDCYERQNRFIVNNNR